MKIALVSDLHLEFAPVTLPKTEADVLLMAGDIVPIAYLSEKRTDAQGRSVQKRVYAFIEETLSQYKTIFHIMGNHEYYHGFWEDTVDEFREFWADRAPQVTVLNKEAASVGGFMLWGGTFWTDFGGANLGHMRDAQDGMNDYHKIKTLREGAPYIHRYTTIKPLDTYQEHEESRYTLKETLEAAEDKQWVVMTHHLPSWRSVQRRYAGDPCNWAYTSDMDQFIVDHPQIKVWVHGHSHHSEDYMLEKTRILANPRGYSHPNSPTKSENSDFNPNFVFEI